MKQGTVRLFYWSVQW